MNQSELRIGMTVAYDELALCFSTSPYISFMIIQHHLAEQNLQAEAVPNTYGKQLTLKELNKK